MGHFKLALLTRLIGLGSNIDTFKVSFTDCLVFLYFLMSESVSFKMGGWLAFVLFVGDGVGIMCDGNDVAQRSLLLFLLLMEEVVVLLSSRLTLTVIVLSVVVVYSLLYSNQN